ncbi:MAG: helix-turn-helix domain-containing protein [Caldilineaceae bacterium]
MQKDSAAIPLASFTTFGALLRYLRRRAQLTQRDLGIAVGYSEGHITRLEKNQRLPDLTALMALFVPALLPDQEPETVGRLLALAAVARGERLPEQPPVTAAPVQSVAPHPHPQQAPPHNIPAPLTPLFGRTAEVQNVCQHLLHPDVRLLTLTGPPGVGKTRLSLGVAAALLEQFAQGVYFVSLAPLTDPSMVAGAIAHILDIKEGAASRCGRNCKASCANSRYC